MPDDPVNFSAPHTMKRFLLCLLIPLLAMTGCATQSQNTIIGTWSEAGTATLIQFQADGLVKVITGTETTAGTYSFEPPSTLTLRFDGATGKPGPHRATCSLRGDSMQLQWSGGETLQYTRLEKSTVASEPAHR